MGEPKIPTAISAHRMANKSIKNSITGHLPFLGKERHRSISTKETTKISAPPIKKSKGDQFTSLLTNPPISGMDKSSAVAIVGQYQSGLVCDMELKVYRNIQKTPALRAGVNSGFRPFNKYLLLH
jgi:hypothetical protein